MCAGYLTILATRVTCVEFSQCYDDVGICLWTNGSQLTQSAADAACQQRNNSFLPRVTNNAIQSKLEQFRTVARDEFGTSGFWIDVRAVNSTNWHWIDGSSFAGIFNVMIFALQITEPLSM